MKYTNDANLDLILQVWLLNDDYDHVKEDNYFSITSLMKPVRQSILAKKVDTTNMVVDISSLSASSYGSAIHDSIEKVWDNPAKRDKALKLLGIPEKVRDSILINPEPEEVEPHHIPVYFERRTIREIEVDGITYLIGGKFDTVAQGIVKDQKSTSVFSWMSGRKDEDYTCQLSCYRWLNPQIITEDYGQINFIFTDWQRANSLRDPNYPSHRFKTETFNLWSIEETEAWIVARIRQWKANSSKAEKDIVKCTDKELWRSEPVFKYYSDPTKIDGRATKNFDTFAEANQHMTEKGKGIVITVPGSPKACTYCAAFTVCSQGQEYFK